MLATARDQFDSSRMHMCNQEEKPKVKIEPGASSGASGEPGASSGVSGGPEAAEDTPLKKTILCLKGDTKKVLRRLGEVDPSNTSASRAVNALHITEDHDFDDGIRKLKCGVTNSNKAMEVAQAIQYEVINDHNNASRDANGDLIGLPRDVANLLGEGWRPVPHDFKSNLKHVRGSFASAVKATAAITQSDASKALAQHMGSKLRAFSDDLHQAAKHDTAPEISLKDAQSRKSSYEPLV